MNASLSFRVLAEKKEIRACYRSLRRAAKYLRDLSRTGLVHCNPALPQGWRRELRAGYPTGILAEVNLGVAGSLRAFGALAALEGKGSDAALASDASENLIGLIREKLLDGGVAGLVLNIDEKGRLHREESIDEVLACYRLSLSNSLTAALARRMLEKAGHSVVVAGNGRQALRLLEEQPFDLVFMDLQMPEMGGLEATAAIRDREKRTGEHIPIVAMTAHAMTGDRERCLSAGMDGYLSKPIQGAALLELVAEYSNAGLG